MEKGARLAKANTHSQLRLERRKKQILRYRKRRRAELQQAELELLNRQHDKLADSVVDTIVHVIRGRRTRSINRLLFGEGDSAVIDRINLAPSNFYAMAQGLLESQFRRAQERGELREGVTLEEASQWLARVILSLVTYPEEFLDDDEALRRFLWRFLVPSLVADKD